MSDFICLRLTTASLRSWSPANHTIRNISPLVMLEPFFDRWDRISMFAHMASASMLITMREAFEDGPGPPCGRFEPHR